MPTYYHGTSQHNADSIRRAGLLAEGQYVSSDFELAASYALRNVAPAVVVVEGEAGLPDEVAFDEIEFVALKAMSVTQVLKPTFSSKPSDWYDLDDTLERRHPHLFQIGNWT